MKSGLIALALLAASMATASAQAPEGRYKVDGKNADGSSYSGEAEIVGSSADTCRITWNVGSEAKGFCMKNSNALAAAYTLGESVGLIIYQIMDDGTLVGKWTIADQDGVGTEILTPIK
jgi:hypothetical protein